MGWYVCQGVDYRHKEHLIGPGISLVILPHKVTRVYLFHKTKPQPQARSLMAPVGIQAPGAGGAKFKLEIDESESVYLSIGQLILLQGSSILAITEGYPTVKGVYG